MSSLLVVAQPYNAILSESSRRCQSLGFIVYISTHNVPAEPKPPAAVELLLPNTVDPPNVLLFDGVEPKPRCDKIKVSDIGS